MEVWVSWLLQLGLGMSVFDYVLYAGLFQMSWILLVVLVWLYLTLDIGYLLV